MTLWTNTAVSITGSVTTATTLKNDGSGTLIIISNNNTDNVYFLAFGEDAAINSGVRLEKAPNGNSRIIFNRNTRVGDSISAIGSTTGTLLISYR